MGDAANYPSPSHGDGRNAREQALPLKYFKPLHHDANIKLVIISNKDMLYSTGKYSHYFVITLNGV